MIPNPIFHVDQCKSEINKFFPGQSLSQIRSEVVANETFGTKVYDGKNPFFMELSRKYIPKREDRKDIKSADCFVELVNEMTSAILWDKYKIIYTLDTELATALKKTNNLVFTRDVFDRIPYKAFYLNLSLLTEYNAEGCIVVVSGNKNSNDMILLSIQLIGCDEVNEGDGTYEFIVFISNKGKSPISKTNKTVTDGIFFDDENGQFIISTKDYIEASIKGKKALLKKTRAAYAINQDNPYLFLPLRKKMISLELLVLQFIMYITSDNPDIEMSRVTKRQIKRNRRLGKNDLPYSEPEEWNVGMRYGKTIRLYNQEQENIDGNEENKSEEVHRHHRPPRPHMRRAHWQYYRVGKGRKEYKHVWIAPTYVNGASVDLPITKIDVTDKESKGYDGENQIKEYLKAKRIKFRFQYTVKSIGKRFDFCVFIGKQRLMIEFDGEQHFNPVEYWGGEQAYIKQRESDSMKNEWCENQKVPLLRIRYDQKPYIQEMIEDFIKNSDRYILEHNTFMSNMEYYSICY